MLTSTAPTKPVLCMALATLLSALTMVVAAGIGSPHAAWAQKASDAPDALPHAPKLRLASWPESFHPLASRSGDGALLFSLIHAPLLQYTTSSSSSSGGKVLPYLAKEWSFSSDKTTINLTLFPHLTFSSGEPLQVEDIRHTFELLQNKEKCSACSSLRESLPSAVEVRAHSSQKRRFSLVFQSSVSQNLALKALSKIPILSKNAPLPSSTEFQQALKEVVGAGPYAIDTQVSSYRRFLVLRKRSDLKAPLRQDFSFKTLQWVYLEDHQLAYEALLKKRIHALRLPPEIPTPPARLSAPQLKIWSHKVPPGYRLQMLVWNTRHGALADKGFRQIMSALIDPTAVVKKFFSQELFKPIGHPWELFDSQAPKLYQSSKGIAQRLRELGYEKRNAEGAAIKKDAQGREVVAQLRVLYSHTQHGPWLQQLKKTARGLGILIEAHYTSLAELLKSMQSARFDGALLTAHHLYNPLQLWDAGSPLYDSGWSGKTPPQPSSKKAMRAAVHALAQSHSLLFLWRLTTQRWGYWNQHLKPPSWAHTTSWSQLQPPEIWQWQPVVSS